MASKAAKSSWCWCLLEGPVHGGLRSGGWDCGCCWYRDGRGHRPGWWPERHHHQLAQIAAKPSRSASMRPEQTAKTRCRPARQEWPRPSPAAVMTKASPTGPAMRSMVICPPPPMAVRRMVDAPAPCPASQQQGAVEPTVANVTLAPIADTQHCVPRIAQATRVSCWAGPARGLTGAAKPGGWARPWRLPLTGNTKACGSSAGKPLGGHIGQWGLPKRPYSAPHRAGRGMSRLPEHDHPAGHRHGQQHHRRRPGSPHLPGATSEGRPSAWACVSS